MIMWRPMRVLSLAGILALGTTFGALAQSDSTAAEEAPEPKPIEEELSLGEDANATPAVGQPYRAEEIGDWDLRCVKSEADTDPCQMYQLLSDSQEAPIAEFSLFRLPEGGRAVAGATIVVPLETALQQQLTIVVDGGEARRYPYSFCNTVGCYARIGLTNQDVTAFKRGNSAKLSIVPIAAPDQKVEVVLSLSGFTAAFGKVSIIDQ